MNTKKSTETSNRKRLSCTIRHFLSCIIEVISGVIGIENAYEEDETDEPKSRYHAGLKKISLLIRAVLVLVGGLLFGMLGATLIDKANSLIAVERGNFFGDVYSNFTGGALGLMVAFVVDKSCFEKINCISRYEKIIVMLHDELEDVRKGSPFFEIVLKIDFEGNLAKVSGKELKKNGDSTYKDIYEATTENSFETMKLNKANDEKKDEVKNVEGIDCGLRFIAFVVDDLVRSAENGSILTNLPLAKEYGKRLSLQLRLVCKYMTLFNNETVDSPEKLRRWISLQYALEKTKREFCV